MIDKDTIRRFESKLDVLLNKAHIAYGISFSRPKLVFRQLGRSAGWANYATNVIELNSDFCHNGHLDEMVNETLPHEVAHLISVKKYGLLGYGHKQAWKSVMDVFGVNGTRCHNYKLDGVKIRKRKTFNYHCQCRKTITISSIIHNRIQRRCIYKCSRCGAILKQCQ